MRRTDDGARRRRAGLSREPAPGADGGTQVGKRYADESGALEVLCTRAGAGSLAVGGVPVAVKDARPLPSSD